jgi:hypothetical protein
LEEENEECQLLSGEGRRPGGNEGAPTKKRVYDDRGMKVVFLFVKGSALRSEGVSMSK